MRDEEVASLLLNEEAERGRLGVSGGGGGGGDVGGGGRGGGGAVAGDGDAGGVGETCCWFRGGSEYCAGRENPADDGCMMRREQ